MFKDELKKFVQDNPRLVTMRESESHPGLYVLKYKKRVFYDSLWNDYLEECRGTIVDKDFNIVARPFTKIYNYGVEAKAPKLSDNTLVTAYRKVNGFMCSLTWYNNDILVSTTGSTQNDYVDYAKEMMLKHQCWADWQMEILAAKGMTLMFECVHPNDPHIVPEDAGMYFLGHRENSWDSKVEMYGVSVSNWAKDYALSCLKCNYAESYVLPLSELVAKSKQVRHEGFVFYTVDGVSAKIKSPYYLTSKWVARNPKTEKLLTKEFKEQIDEEFYPLLTHIQNNISYYTSMNEQERLQFIRKFFE
jgi:hypothetical protein